MIPNQNGNTETICRGCCSAINKIESRQNDTVAYLRKIGVGKRYYDCSFDNFHGGDKYIEFCWDWYIKREESIFFTGSFGCGKTHLAVALCRELIKCSELYSVRFEFSIDLLYQIRKTFSSSEDTDSLINQLANVDYLVIDDLGAEKTTEWSIETMSLIIDRRDREMRPTIITSNLSLGEVAEKISGRIASRMANGKIVKIEMPDYRRKRNNRG
jgi:DNA replication protein DnaC